MSAWKLLAAVALIALGGSVLLLLIGIVEKYLGPSDWIPGVLVAAFFLLGTFVKPRVPTR